MSDAMFSIIDSFAECRVLCVGDVMLDRFVYGQVDRISPEAPIPVFSIREERSMLGGAGNVARNLVALGARRTTFIAVTGNDKTGHEITALIGKEPLIAPFLIPESGRLSTIKTRYVAGTQQVLRADHEVAAPVLPATSLRVVEAALSELANQDAVILSDYGKGVLTRETIAAIIAAAKSQGKPVIVDPKSRDFSMYRGANCISPNLHELSNAAAAELRTEDDIIRAARHLLEAHDIERMLVTRSSKGMTLITRTGEVHHIAARAQEVFDVSGAGDTAIAALTLGIAAGLSFADAAALSNIAAGIVVGRLGTAVATIDDMKTALLAKQELACMQKILPLAVAVTQVEKWKREGKVVGFTNGCFDLIHRGHLSLLGTCKQHCDKLIVGLNSDASVKRLKGQARPVNAEQDRALLLASLSVVDGVVLFEDDTPLALIEALRPSVLIKGADYEKHQVVGHEIVEGYGGKIILIPLKEGYSTTNIIRKMA
jgi:D-beta-D-heptose 7-phosphate kinase / D-beta-D-heptose 1-phosphate adenosyltransferase